MERTTVAAVLLMVAALRTTTAQEPTTAPAMNAPTTYPPMTGQPTTGPPSGSQMDLSSDGSSSGGTNGPYTWTPMPTVDTGGSGFNWTRGDAASDLSSSSSSSSSGSVHSGDREPSVEVYLPGLDADIAALTRRKYTFNATQGFVVNATRGGLAPGNCTHHAYCMHFVFESDYGAMSPFDAFVLDRFESAGGPVGGFSHGNNSGGPNGWVGGPVPLVLGRMSNATFDKLGGHWSDVLNWNESRRTTWTLYPSPHARASNEIDLTLSLKQLYTLLPGYKESVNNRSRSGTNNGPFYSADLSDQVIIRVQAQIASPFAGASAMLPLVVNHTGSQLVDISLSSSLLYTGNGAQGGNEMQLTFKLTRRKYGGALPWSPAEPSHECAQCEALQRSSADTFEQCLNRKLEGMQLVMQDLLTFTNNRTQFDMEPFAEACFAEMLGNSTNTTTAPPVPTMQSYWNGTDWVEYMAMPPPQSTMGDGWSMLRNTDAALRCWAKTQCNLAGASVKSDGQIVVLHHEPARTEVDFRDSDARFYLQLGLEDASQDEIITTQVFYYSQPASFLAQEIARAFPNADQLQLDIEVRKSNNSREVHEIRAYNQRLLDAYYSALRWSEGSDESAGSAGSTGSQLDREDAGYKSPGSAGSSWGPTAGSGSGSEAASWGPTVGPATAQPTVQPQRPTLQYEPAERFTIEIISHNITVVPHVVAVFSSNYIANRKSTDNALRFQVAPLDVSKFQYVAPPASVDLSWHSEPAWKTEARRLLPSFGSNDSCVHCARHFEACLLDEDCVYGVNSYFADAVAWHRLANRIYVGDSPSFGGPELKNIRVDASDALLQAKWFFPNNGFAKLEQLLSCWSMMSCSLDEPRNELRNATTGEWRLAPPTKIQFTGAEMDMVTTEFTNITVFNGMRHVSYTITHDAMAFQNFLTDVVFPDATNARDLVVFPTNPDTTMRPGEIQFTVRWHSASHVPMSVGGSEAMMRHGKLEISTIRSAAHVANGWQDLSWQRLAQWLGLFRSVPFGNANTNNSTGGWNSTNTNNNSTTNTTTPTNLPPPTTVCPACADALLSCVQDAGCASAARTWMATVLPSATMASYHDWNGFLRTMWNSEALSADATTSTLAIPEVHRDRLLSLTACLATHSCAVGYSRTNATGPSDSAFVPTTLTLQAERTLFTPPTTGFALSYKQNQLAWAYLDENSDLAGTVFAQIGALFGHYIRFTRYYVDDIGMYHYTFNGPREALTELSFSAITAPGNVSAITYWASFLSPWPTPPVWGGLVSWLDTVTTAADGSSELNSTQNQSLDAVCAACLPKVQACFNDQECWRSVQDMVVPTLKQAALLPATSTWTTDGTYLYAADLGTILLQQVVETPTQSFFTTPASWQAFTDVLRCFAMAQCDVETMDSAMEPPATAHVPSYLRMQPAQIKLELHMDTRVETMVNGELLAFSEYGMDSTVEIESFVRNAVNGSADMSLNINRTVSDQATNVFTYTVLFGDNYFGRVPQMYIASAGHVVEGTAPPFVVVTPWRVAIESINQSPEWDKLLNLLAVAPSTSGTGTTSTSTALPPSYLVNCLNGDTVKSECYNDYECKYLLTSVVLPLLKTTLEATPANFNSSLNVFEIDLTAPLVSQIMWLAGVSDIAKATVMKLLYETTMCAGSEPATSQTRPVFQNPRVQFTRPARGPLQLAYQGETFSVDDHDPAVDGRMVFQNFVYDNVIALTSGKPGVLIHTWWIEGEQVKYDLEFVRLFKTPLPHLLWVDEITQERLDSSDSAWRMSFQSTSYTIYSEAQGWLAWLTTSPV